MSPVRLTIACPYSDAVSSNSSLTAGQSCSILLNVSESIGQHIRAARCRLLKTLRATAKEAGVSPGLLSMIEQDKHAPTRELISRLADLLEGDVEQWCGLAGKVTPETESAMARLARTNPDFLRTLRAMIQQHGGS